MIIKTLQAGSTAYFRAGHLMTVIILVGFLTLPAFAQQMPREDVVDVPAIGEGLCVSNVFQTNMVLQRDKPISVWGWAEPGEQVTVTFAGQQASGTAGKDRKWKITLPAVSASNKPQKLVVKGKEQSLVLDNLLVGDVWVLGGQSNMEFPLANVENGSLEIISANFPEIRILSVPQDIGPELKSGFARLHQWSDWSGRHFRKGDWDVCTPETVRELSAIGYVFARRVHKASKVPIGVIDASRGGSTVETWTPLPVLRAMDSEPTRAKLAKWDADIAAWDAQQDLEKRIASHLAYVERMTKEGKPIPNNRKEKPSDLRPGPIGNHNHPGHCYAGMIAPIAGLSVKGAIFHQGYNNAFEGSAGADMYRDIFPEMITAWRSAFNDPKMPFGILSLCTDGYPQTRDDYCEKMFNAGIEIRAVQYQTFLDLHYYAGDKNVGFASTYDLRRRWYHPQLKIPAGERIARWALATQYGFERQVEWKPPMLVRMDDRDGGLLLKFNMDVGDPGDGVIHGFAVAGPDRKFHPADVIYTEKGDGRGGLQKDRSQIILRSSMVAQPIHFRYAWGRNPLANLQATGNKDLPFATQRSDNWKMEYVPLGVLGDEATLPLSRGDKNKIIQALREQDKSRRLKEAQQVIEANGG